MSWTENSWLKRSQGTEVRGGWRDLVFSPSCRSSWAPPRDWAHCVSRPTVVEVVCVEVRQAGQAEGGSEDIITQLGVVILDILMLTVIK